MTEGMTCYERDEELCSDEMCLRTGCRLRNERMRSEKQMPARIWVRICGGGVSLPSGRTFMTLAGENREVPNYDAFVRADLAERMADALETIACFSDKGASDVLAKTGSYSRFDEPGSVRTARDALSAFRSATQDTEASHD